MYIIHLFIYILSVYLPIYLYIGYLSIIPRSLSLSIPIHKRIPHPLFDLFLTRSPLIHLSIHPPPSLSHSHSSLCLCAFLLFYH